MIFCGVFATLAQVGRPLIPVDDPSIRYWDRALNDPVAALERKLLTGSLKLNHDETFGYLPALLQQLNVPVESQILVFSKTSLQAAQISPESPRAIYFNDAVAIGWVRGGPILEIAAHDPEGGTIFYTVGQARQSTPAFTREDLCLSCHHTASTLGVPGNLVRTVFPGLTGLTVTGLAGSPSDHRTPYAERWGGWYITGKRGPLRHRANAVVAAVTGDGAGAPQPAAPAAPLQDKFAVSTYPSPYSDIAAMAVFEHQMHMMNLITRVGWEARLGSPSAGAVAELVDYLLFVDEPPLTETIEGSSGFAATFAARGPTDRRGRSLRQLDLTRRLMRYPCSYMIYSAAFQALPARTKAEIYQRLWEILSGKEKAVRYLRLSSADRAAIIEILRETLPGLPEYFDLNAAQ